MELFWYDIREMGDAEYDAAFALLDKARRGQVKNLAQMDDRRRTVAGEKLLRDVMAEKMGVAAKEINISRTDDGKPVIEGSPLHFSISHSGPFVVCAVDENEIGVDIEVVRASDAKFIQRVCSEAEINYIRLGTSGDLMRFWEIWTAKEALFKLTGKGPLLHLSCMDLPERVVLNHMRKNNCAVTVATRV